MLVLTGSPVQREGSENLVMLVDALDSRTDCRATLWYLRAARHQRRVPGSRVVDDLRTWAPARALDAAGLVKPASWLRGRRLRRWLREVDPSVVVLDDGMGARVLDPLPQRPGIVVRRNADLPEHPHLEPPPTTDADLVVVPASDPSEPPPGAQVSVEYPFRFSHGKRFADDSTRREARQALDLPLDEPLVVGWGDDGWLDGPDLFIRVLWALGDRHGQEVHGAWLGLAADPDEAARLGREAERCGVADRFHHRTDDGIAGRLCGDAVLLPYRSAARSDDVLDAAFSGAVVVTFDAAEVDDPDVRSVRDLDVDAAAAALVAGLAEPRPDRTVRRRRRFDPEPLAQDVLAVARPTR